jgi:hypothetical protein
MNSSSGSFFLNKTHDGAVNVDVFFPGGYSLAHPEDPGRDLVKCLLGKKKGGSSE